MEHTMSIRVKLQNWRCAWIKIRHLQWHLYFWQMMLQENSINKFQRIRAIMKWTKRTWREFKSHDHLESILFWPFLSFPERQQSRLLMCHSEGSFTKRTVKFLWNSSRIENDKRGSHNLAKSSSEFVFVATKATNVTCLARCFHSIRWRFERRQWGRENSNTTNVSIHWEEREVWWTHVGTLFSSRAGQFALLLNASRTIDFHEVNTY